MADLGGSRMNNESLYRIGTLVGFLLGIDPVQVHNHKRRKHEAHTALLLPACPRFRNLPAGPLLCAALPFTLTCVCRARRRLSHNSQTLSLSCSFLTLLGGWTRRLLPINSTRIYRVAGVHYITALQKLSRNPFDRRSVGKHPQISANYTADTDYARSAYGKTAIRRRRPKETTAQQRINI